MRQHKTRFIVDIDVAFAASLDLALSFTRKIHLGCRKAHGGSEENIDIPLKSGWSADPVKSSGMLNTLIGRIG